MNGFSKCFFKAQAGYSKTMDAVIKTQTFAGWEYQCYRLTNCQMLQYKKGLDSFNKIVDGNDSQIQLQHDVNKLKCTASLSPKNQPILQIDVDDTQIFLSFDSYKEFVAWFRILFACKAPSSIPSNLSFAIYHLLQSLYKQSSADNAFDDEIKSHNDRIKQLHHELTVHQNLDALIVLQTKHVHINTLFDTLVFTLKHLPSSLLTSHCEQQLTNLINALLVERESAQSVSASTDKHVALFNDTETLGKIEQKILALYQSNNIRYGYIALLFIFLNHISNRKGSKYDLDSLTRIFAEALRSKRLNSDKIEEKGKTFAICVKILIFYAKFIFDGQSVLKMSKLIDDSGSEV